MTVGNVGAHGHTRTLTSLRSSQDANRVATTMRRAVGDPRLGALGQLGAAPGTDDLADLAAADQRDWADAAARYQFANPAAGRRLRRAERRALLEIGGPPASLHHLESPDVCPSGRKRLLHATCTSWMYFGDRVRRCAGPGLKRILGAIRGDRRPMGRGVRARRCNVVMETDGDPVLKITGDGPVIQNDTFDCPEVAAVEPAAPAPLPEAGVIYFEFDKYNLTRRPGGARRHHLRHQGP